MLLTNDVVANGKTKTGTVTRWFGREKRVEHLFFHVRCHTSTVVADSDFDAIANVFGRCAEGRLVSRSLLRARSSIRFINVLGAT